MANMASNYEFTQNRELSWLRFNERVLEEASDHQNPLLERLKFISIFSSNLDEFFMIRVGSLFDMLSINENAQDNKSGMTAKQQLKKIYKAVTPLYQKRDELFHEVDKQLRLRGISCLSMDELENKELKAIKKYYQEELFPILSPQIVDSHHPFPHLPSKVLYIGALLKNNNSTLIALIPVPSSVPDILFPSKNDFRYLPVEHLIEDYAQDIFKMYEVLEKTCFCVTRNADISNEEAMDMDMYVDFRKKMKKLLSVRKRLAVVRLEISSPISDEFQKILCDRFSITSEQVFLSQSPINLRYAFSLENRLPEDVAQALTYPFFQPKLYKNINHNNSILAQVSQRDVLLSYPFESMDTFLQLIKEAAFDKTVLSIRITIYRLSSRAKLVDYLCDAAENGKDVTVLIELRARFDEQNNIDWSEKLESAGCKIIYGIPDYKVHSKICLITRKEKGQLNYITQIGTGNYNEKTAELYTDLCLITSNENFAEDAAHFFNNMALGNIHGEYSHLLVAPHSFKDRILQLIQSESDKGSLGKIIMKMNSITDIDIINKLSEASQNGVRIELIVRGICCILPGVPPYTENIHIISVVGRFLEHSRIFCFGEGDYETIYISSADFMTRNMVRRVEVACPVLDVRAKDKIHHILDILRQDNTKARILTPEGIYEKKESESMDINAQELLIHYEEEPIELEDQRPKTWDKFKETILGFFKQ